MKKIKGPCKGCGETDYELSTSGVDYCPMCACYGPPCRRCEVIKEVKPLTPKE